MKWLGKILGAGLWYVIQKILAVFIRIFTYGNDLREAYKKNKDAREALEKAKSEKERKDAADKIIGNF